MCVCIFSDSSSCIKTTNIDKQRLYIHIIYVYIAKPQQGTTMGATGMSQVAQKARASATHARSRS